MRETKTVIRNKKYRHYIKIAPDTWKLLQIGKIVPLEDVYGFRYVPPFVIEDSEINAFDWDGKI